MHVIDHAITSCIQTNGLLPSDSEETGVGARSAHERLVFGFIFECYVVGTQSRRASSRTIEFVAVTGLNSDNVIGRKLQLHSLCCRANVLGTDGKPASKELCTTRFVVSASAVGT